MKKILSYILIFCVLFSMPMNVGAQVDYDELNSVIADTVEYVYQTTANPQVGSIGGEWAVFGLARSGYEIPDEYYNNYYHTVEQYVKDCNGILSERKYTEYARLVIALTAIGKNPTDVAGYNLLMPLGDYNKTVSQGINGPVWTLIALDSLNYEMPICDDASVQATRDMYVDYILSRQLDNGGWSLTGTTNSDFDADVTGMTLVALSKYRNRDDVQNAVENGLSALSEAQTENGGFLSYGSENCESAVQVIVALCELGISLDDSRFVKNGNTLLDNVMSFYNSGNGFAHACDEETANQMATEQALYALTAVKRILNEDNSLFDMHDYLVFNEQQSTSFGLPNKIDDVQYSDIQYPNKTFDDIANHQNRNAIEALSERGIINGKSDISFDPDATMTRAEFAAIIVRGLGLPNQEGNKFDDVSQNDWYFNSVNTAYSYGIVNGISANEFNPNGTITREEAAAMVARAASLCGMNTDMDTFSARNILAGFIDYVKVSDWAITPVAFCYNNGILDESEIEINPKTAITRAEVAQMLFNMMGKAELL